MNSVGTVWQELRDRLGLTGLIEDVAAIRRQLRHLNHDEETILATLDDLEAKYTTLQGDVSRVLGDLTTIINDLKSQPLPPDVQAKVDDLAAKVDELDTAVNADDQTPPPPPATS